MKLREKTVFVILIGVSLCFLAACSTQNRTDTATRPSPATETNTSSEVVSTENVAAPEKENTIEPENNTTSEESPMGKTPIILEMNGTAVHATLNNSVIAQEFTNLLPYTVTVSRAKDDLCGSVSEHLNSDPSENSQGWKIGEIGWFGGWFTILVDHEEDFSNMSVPIIGNIDEEDIAFVQSLSGSVNIVAKLADVEGGETMQNTSTNQITITVNEKVLTATLANNTSAEALKELLADGPLTISMRDYGGMEKVGPIGQNLPTNDEQITTEAGDLILFMGNAFVIYYAPNSWNFTRLGKIDNIGASELKNLLGKDAVTVTLQMLR